jgi:hypothetical protein
MANKRTSTVLEEEERAKAQRDLKALIEQTLGDVGYEAESLSYSVCGTRNNVH